MVYAPDKIEEGTFERRLSVRPSHLEEAQKRIADGFIRELYQALHITLSYCDLRRRWWDDVDT